MHSSPVESIPTLYKGIPTLSKVFQLCPKYSNPREIIPTLQKAFQPCAKLFQHCR
jgi:hypothetical protein